METGLTVALPIVGTEYACIAPRSGLAIRNFIGWVTGDVGPLAGAGEVDLEGNTEWVIEMRGTGELQSKYFGENRLQKWFCLCVVRHSVIRLGNSSNSQAVTLSWVLHHVGCSPSQC